MKKLELLANVCVYLAPILLVAAIMTEYAFFVVATLVTGVTGLISLLILDYLYNKY